MGEAMDEREEQKERIRGAVVAYYREQFAIRCEAAWIDLHPSCILATVTGASSPAERDSAREKESCARLEKLYSDLFETSKRELESAIAEITGQPVVHSWLSVDMESGDHIIRFAVAEQRDRPSSGE